MNRAMPRRMFSRIFSLVRICGFFGRHQAYLALGMFAAAVTIISCDQLATSWGLSPSIV